MDDLAALLAEGDLYSVEPDDDGFTVSYDDVLAHEYADLVAESVTAIAGVPGVSEVVHEDRELLLVRAAGVSERQVAGALAAFWRDAARRPLPWKETLKTLAAAVAPTLKAAGFRKQALRWNRETTPGFVQVIELSRVEAGAGYVGAVDVGLFDDELAQLRHRWSRPKFVQEADGQVRRSMGTFGLTDDPSTLRALIEADVLPFLETHTSRRELLAAEEAGTRLLNPIDRAIALTLEGDPAAAHAILQERFDTTGARAHIVEVAARLALPPIETGTDPTRSRAEEAFLPRWIADQPSSVDRFRTTMGEAGIDPADLDGSLRSLDELHPDRWRPVVGHRHEADPPVASSPFRQLPRNLWASYDRSVWATPPSPAVKELAEDLASYLGFVLRTAAPSSEWILLSTGSGLQPAIRLTPDRREPAAVMKVAVEYTTAALGPLTPEQERLYRRYHPLRADVDRWLEAAPAASRTAGRRRRWPFRRG